MPAARPAVLFPWRCPRCIRLNNTPAATSQRLPIRSLTTSTPLEQRHRASRSLNNEALNLPASSRIRAESPRYIDVPQPKQPQAFTPPWIKGIIPVPRDVFPIGDQQALEKASPARLAAMAQEHRRVRGSPSLTPAQMAHNAYKTRQAAHRRTNLRLGLAALAGRTRRRQAALERKQAASARERESLIARGERADEALTRATVPGIVSAPLRTRHAGPLPDPNRAARLAAKAARADARTASRADATRGALHELFMAARRFIVTEPALDAAIEAEFGTQSDPRAWRGRQPSAWADGAPPTLSQMAREAGRTRRDGDEDVSLTGQRLRRVAEQLTGGRM